MKHLILSILAFVSLPFLASSQTLPQLAAEGIDLYVSLYYKTAWDNSDVFTSDSAGIYKITAGTAVLQCETAPVMVRGGVAYNDGKVYINSLDNLWKIYDLDTGELKQCELDEDGLNTTTLTYNITDDKVYGVVSANDSRRFYLAQIDPETGENTNLGYLEEKDYGYLATCPAIAADKYGTIYAIYTRYPDMSGTLRFGRIQKDGTVIYIGDVSVSGMLESDYLSVFQPTMNALIYNRQSDRLYWMHCGSSSYLDAYYSPIFEISFSTGNASMLGYLPQGYVITGAFFNEPLLDAPTGIDSFDYVYSSASDNRTIGHLSLVAPSQSYDGSTLTGSLTIVINDGDSEVARIASVSPGATVTTDDLLFSYGEHTFSCYAISDGGTEGVVRTFNKWIGYDLPSNPTDALLTADGHMLILTWNAPTTGMHGEDLDSDAIYYRVYRYYDGSNIELVNDGLTETTYTQEIPGDLTRYLFVVYACYDGYNGGGIYSNTLIAGDPLEVPYYTDFSDLDEFVNTYKIVDSNNDGHYWTWYYYGAVYPYSETNNADDWLFTPPVNYVAGHTYMLTVNIASSLADYPESMEIGFGDNDVDGQDVLLVIDEVPGEPTDYSVEITPEESGVYYFGFHATSPKFCELLWLYSVEIIDVAESGVTEVAANDGMEVSVAGKTVTVHNPEGLDIVVYTINGMLVAASANMEFTTELPAGVYVVKCGDTVEKVMVK